jgi:hypothetical protein
MKKIINLLFLTLLLGNVLFADGLIHPLDFKGSEVEKERVIKFIEENVKETYTALGMGDATTLRMMEKEELKCFKELTSVQNRELLDQVISTYCSIGMCNYSTILMMYNEELKASSESLSW